MPHFTRIARPKLTPSIPPSLQLRDLHDLKVFPRLIVQRRIPFLCTPQNPKSVVAFIAKPRLDRETFCAIIRRTVCALTRC